MVKYKEALAKGYKNYNREEYNNPYKVGTDEWEAYLEGDDLASEDDYIERKA